jgi:hypothetical protein
MELEYQQFFVCIRDVHGSAAAATPLSPPRVRRGSGSFQKTKI